MTHVFPPFEPENGARERGARLGRAIGLGPRQIPIRVLVPSIFTLIALCAGLTAVRMAIEHRYDLAIAAIVLAAFLDGVDGRVARLLKASSRFGAELDSLADFVNFGVAPAVVVFTWALGDLRSLGWIVVLVFALCAALRLARFNVSLDATDQPAWKSDYFVGVPAPAAALVLMFPLYLDGMGVPAVASFTPGILIYTLAVAFLMVSRVPTFSGKLIGQRIEREYVLPVFVLAVLFVAVLLTYPYITLTVGTLAYIAVMPLSFASYRRQEARAAEKARAQNGSGKRAGKQRTGEEERPPAP